LEKVQKLFSFFSQNDDLELKHILKDEIDRLLRDAKNQSKKVTQELSNCQKLINHTSFENDRHINH